VGFGEEEAAVEEGQLRRDDHVTCTHPPTSGLDDAGLSGADVRRA
jgi:hypothetical protein